MLIRPFQLADQAAVIDLWRRCDLIRPWNDPYKDIQRKLAVQPELFLVGELDGALVASAMAGYEGHRGWVNYLAVCPDRRKQGLARQLMQYIEEKMLALGCPKLSLLVRNTNQQALAFYERLGYQVDASVSLGKRLISDE
ncbi:GNAT family acetyltransferase [Pseudomonas sp. GOM7]|uniref:GNAT family acetyltransferase n=1 Tax=Pseudomonas sp. GOM7 TaxID=2998079 RepID=UPI00227BA7DB|nr:GNAT family acetyltransferase [Pseudomonas sp. GOM7]WAJ35636.1 GNAT family acetyltransferase [Pseudomonas sp. GOM7]